MRKITYIAIAAIALAGCERGAQLQPPSVAVPETAVGDEIADVSLIQLIANPDRFEGKKVRVVGYIHREFESNGIYLHKDDYELSIYRNGLWLNGSCASNLKEYNDHYVLMEARFTGKDQGHMGLWSGALSEVTRCVPWVNEPRRSASNNSFKPRPLRGSA